MPSLTEVAKAAGVSLTTASMVLNPGKQENRVSQAVSERVKQIARQLGYTPNYHARSMKLGRADTIAVALDIGDILTNPSRDTELTQPYFSHLVGTIELTMRNNSIQTTIVGPDGVLRAPDKALLGIRQRRFDGAIVLGAVVRTELTNFLSEKSDKPLVVLQPNRPCVHAQVTFDEKLAVKLAVDHLKALGHRSIVWVEGRSMRDGNTASQRELQFMTEMWDAGLRGTSCRWVDDERGVESFTATESKIARGAYLHFTEFYKQKGKDFTAVVAFNDNHAIGICQALYDLGISIPQQMSIISFDDVYGGLSVPPLTTVSHEFDQMAKRAAELLLEMIRDEKKIAEHAGRIDTIKPVLVTRRSTGPARPN
jgi:LacI family transcriptional regulator